MKFQITALQNDHIKKNFTCGNALLDNYLRTQARQDVSRDLSACFVLAGEDQIVKGFYTLSASSVRREIIPDHLSKKLPSSYSALPTILLGRLACDVSVKGQGYGAILLIDALKRSLESAESIGALAVIVDPIDESATAFYSKYGFIILSGGKMFLPMKTIKSLFSV